MHKDLSRTCTAIVLLVNPFVLWRSRCLYRRVLRKFSILSCAVRKVESNCKNEPLSVVCIIHVLGVNHKMNIYY